jgi:hypothetical protein
LLQGAIEHLYFVDQAAVLEVSRRTSADVKGRIVTVDAACHGVLA